MAKTTKVRRYPRKRVLKRLRKRGNTFNNLVPRNNVFMGLGFPKKMVVRQKYIDTFQMSSVSGALSTHQYALNGLYDPDITASGHQPMYFDQYMAIYNHYTVIGCKMTVRFMGHESMIVPMNVALWQNDDSTITPSLLNTYGEQSKSQVFLIGSDGGNSKTLTLKWSPRKTFGPVLANTLLRGNNGANPQETSVGVIAVQSADGIQNGTMTVQVMLEFITVYTELRDIVGS